MDEKDKINRFADWNTETVRTERGAEAGQGIELPERNDRTEAIRESKLGEPPARKERTTV